MTTTPKLFIVRPGTICPDRIQPPCSHGNGMLDIMIA
jgi:hypothetical protein